MTIPPAKIRTTIYLSPDVWQQARLAAVASRRSTSALIEELLEAYLWSNSVRMESRGTPSPASLPSQDQQAHGQPGRRASDESSTTE